MFLLLRHIYSTQMLTFDKMTSIFNILLKFYLFCVYIYSCMCLNICAMAENKGWELVFLLLPRGAWELNSGHQS